MCRSCARTQDRLRPTGCILDRNDLLPRSREEPSPHHRLEHGELWSADASDDREALKALRYAYAAGIIFIGQAITRRRKSTP